MANKNENNPTASPTATSRIAAIWSRSGLDGQTLLNMVKFALPPTIALCMFQADAVANTFSTVGYLIAVGTILSSVLAPRAAYLEATACNIVFISTTTAVATLAMWTVIQARKHTTAPGTPAGAYNSSAAAVSGVWLFSMIYVINVGSRA